MLKIQIVFFAIATVFILSGCNPDEVGIEIFTSDIKIAATESVVEVPVIATFSILGEDTEGYFSKATDVAKEYLGDTAEFEVSKGDWGDLMVIKCTIPLGTEDGLKKYLAEMPRPIALTIKNSAVILSPTMHFDRLNRQLRGIDMMLSLGMPARSTVLRFVGDMAEAPQIEAYGVFVDKVPKLFFKEKVERRKIVDVEYRGGSASVYSQLPPKFFINF